MPETDIEARYAIELDGAQVGTVDRITFRDYRHTQARTFEQLAPRTGWVDSALSDVHDRRYQATAVVLVHGGGVDPDESRTVARSPRVTLRRVSL
jgi:hypothetical protein